MSDEEEDQIREKQMLALELFSNFLNTAEATLDDITERENSGHQVLGPGIVRVCNDLADEIESMAGELHKQHIQAARHLEKVRSDHELKLIEEGVEGEEKKSNLEFVESTNQTTLALSTLANSQSNSSLRSHEEFVTTLSTTHTLLLDMAAALRAISQKEAQELGEVALEVARMFVWSLGKVHSSMIQRAASNDSQYHPTSSFDDVERQEDVAMAKTSGSTKQVTWSIQGPVTEILGEEEKKDDHARNNYATPTKKPSAKKGYTPLLTPVTASPGSPATSTSPINVLMGRHSHAERVRVLWPPLLPAVTEVGKHCANSARDHPIPAIAIGLTCGPAAIATAAIAGPPLLVTDWVIQTTYDALSEHTPVIETVEKGAANALQVTRLSMLCSKLIIKQGISVGERQIERRGGVGKICSDVVGGAVDMALHPVETVGMAWEGMWWMGGAVKDVVGFVQDTVSGGEFADLH